jgi:hypothetical protein
LDPTALLIHHRTEGIQMKKRVTTFLFVLILLIVSLSPVYAGGGQVRGNNGQGAVNQVQVQDPPPFQP